MDTMEHTTRRRARQHPAAQRQQVLTECDQPGASVARVAQSHGLNANMAHAWRRREWAVGDLISGGTTFDGRAPVHLPVGAGRVPPTVWFTLP
jgi:transposase-like protein